METTSSRCARAVMASLKMVSSSNSSINKPGREKGIRSLKRLADSKSCRTASRSRSAAAPRTPPRSARARSASANGAPSKSSAALQMAKSRSEISRDFLSDARPAAIKVRRRAMGCISSSGIAPKIKRSWLFIASRIKSVDDFCSRSWFSINCD